MGDWQLQAIEADKELIVYLEAEVVRLRSALEKIAGEDYRGPKPWASVFASQVLRGSADV